MKRVLVLGRSGQVARALVALAAGEGYQATAVGRPDVDLLSVDPAALIAQQRPGLIVNAAAYTAVDKAESEPEAAFAVNAALPGRFARAAAQAGVPFVQISTDYVFDGTLDRPYREDDAVNPLGVYGRSKLQGEEAVMAAGGNAAVVRTAWVYAAEGSNFVRTMLRLAKDREEIGVVADQLGNPSLADEVARACLRIASAGGRGVFHAAGCGEASWADFAEAVFAASAELGGPSAWVRRITTADYPTPAVRPANSRLDCSKLQGRTGWRPADWRETLKAVMPSILAA